MKCPFCHSILSDELIKREGASLMGKAAKGKKKQRPNAVQAAAQRWNSKQKTS